MLSYLITDRHTCSKPYNTSVHNSWHVHAKGNVLLSFEHYWQKFFELNGSVAFNNVYNDQYFTSLTCQWFLDCTIFNSFLISTVTAILHLQVCTCTLNCIWLKWTLWEKYPKLSAVPGQMHTLNEYFLSLYSSVVVCHKSRS